MKKANAKVAINNLRVLSCEMVENAGNGHPGMCLSAAPIMYSLYANVMNYDPNNPNSLFRDRFVLSAGHGSALLYATLHMFGFDITKEDLKAFRTIDSKTPGHPEKDITPGVDCSTGALGQGLASAVGMAIEAKRFQTRYGKMFDNHIFCLCGDGDLMEGVSYEAVALAGNLKLDNLVVVYDYNSRTIDGSLSNVSCEDVINRFQANKWRVYRANGKSHRSITKAIRTAKKHDNKPTLVVVKTQIGFGTDLVDNEACHGAPIGREQIDKLKENLKINVDGFEVLPEVAELCRAKVDKRRKPVVAKDIRFERMKKGGNELYKQIESRLNYEYNADAINAIDNFQIDEEISGRDLNHKLLNIVAQQLPSMVGGSADLERSTKAYIEGGKHIVAKDFSGNNIHYGIREFAMASINNGIALYNSALPFCSTFLVFADYMKPAIRMSALMNLPCLYIFTHDSITIGQDGPTHQPIDQLAMLRAIPNLEVYRCYNVEELKEAYKQYLTNKKPTVIVVSKSKYKMVKADTQDVTRGAYILSEKWAYDYTLVSSGEDLDLALKVDALLGNKCRGKVVSVYNTKLFLRQMDRVKNILVNLERPVVFLGYETSFGWSDIVGAHALYITMETFGASGTRDEVLNKFEFTPEKIAQKIMKFVKDEEFELPKEEPEGVEEVEDEISFDTNELKNEVEEFGFVDEDSIDNIKEEEIESGFVVPDGMEQEQTVKKQSSGTTKRKPTTKKPAKKSNAKKKTTKRKVQITEIPFSE